MTVEKLEMFSQVEKQNGVALPEKEEENKELEKKCPKFGKRHVQVIIYFLLIFLAYGIRVTLSVAIVAMTDPHASTNKNIPTYPDWHDKSIALSAFFWGYVIPQMIAGWLANTYGPKWFLVVSMCICSLFGVLLPSMADLFGSSGVMASRAIQGLCQGFFFPSVHNLLSQWVPPNERSRLGTLVYAAGPFGTVVSMLVTGAISASWYGWPLVFYVYGVAGLLWCILMAVFGFDSPSTHPSIDENEKYFIENSLGHGDHQGKRKTPWRKMLTSPATWAILVAQCGQNWGFWTLMTEIPTYMSHVMDFDITANSLLSAFPYFILWVLSFVFSAIADLLINRKIASIGATRKIFTSIGLVVPAIALVFLGYTSADETHRAVALLVIAVGVNSAIYCGFNVNHMDLTPNFAGTLMGFTNGISNIFGIVAPLLVQALVTNEKDPEDWRIIFFMTSAVYVFTNTIFAIFGKGEVQEWNDEDSTKEKSIKDP